MRMARFVIAVGHTPTKRTMPMSDYFFLLITTALVNNVVLVKFLGLCPFMGVSKRIDSALGMGMATTFVMLLAASVCWNIRITSYNVCYTKLLRAEAAASTALTAILTWPPKYCSARRVRSSRVRCTGV